ncbi:hypothetical protein SAY86_000632 [Trapa natans]|uniref:Uncharacterized protein n=1 Tax=Trapa natans TaxID=22666 RepID=A0AAN7RE22_TRANT|nr:hypothetical protein SAY86_000632 [Trapa natans]
MHKKNKITKEGPDAKADEAYEGSQVEGLRQQSTLIPFNQCGRIPAAKHTRHLKPGKQAIQELTLSLRPSEVISEKIEEGDTLGFDCFRRRKMLISNPKSNCSVPHSDSVSYLSLLVLLCYLQSSGEKVEKFQEDPSELRTRVSILCLG